MTSSKASATSVGVLFFVATAAYLTGSGLIASGVNAAGDLASVNRDQVRAGVLFELVNSAAVVAIAVLLFPVLRKYSERCAVGYLAARTTECGLLVVSALSAPVDMRTYQFAFQLAMIALGAGSLTLCYVLYRYMLVPRALSALGVVGYLALFVSGWLSIFGRDEAVVLLAPGAVFEILFPLWLIVKGLNEPSVSSAVVLMMEGERAA